MIGVWLLVAVVALLLGLVVGLLAATDPQRMLRAYRDPRLVARVDARARELVARGWVAVAGEAGEPSTIRRLRRAAPGCEEVSLTIGCTPRVDWCWIEIVADIGVDDDVTVAPALKGDRDGPIAVTPQIVQRRGAGFVVEPADGDVGLEPFLVDRGARRREVTRRRQLERLSVAQRDHRLHRALAERTLTHERGAPVVTQRAGHDLRTRCRAAVDEHDERLAVERVAGRGGHPESRL